jgi:tRNA threonylcarbamoyladenosine biosynthesis protein TsaB
MIIVALDACGKYAVTALRSGDQTVYASAGGEGAVRSVYSAIDRAIEKAAIAPAQLDAIVVNTGPGSWTGVRISVTYTASLAFGAGARAFGFSGFAIGKRLGRGVAFVDQLGKTVSEAGAEAAEEIISLFPDVSAEEFLASRRLWLDEMLKLGAEALSSGAPGDPLELQTTYFQEFLTGART